MNGSRGTPWLTIDLTDCSVASRVVVMVQWLVHLTCNSGDAGSIPTHGIMCFSFERDQLVVRCRYMFTLHYLYIYTALN